MNTTKTATTNLRLTTNGTYSIGDYTYYTDNLGNSWRRTGSSNWVLISR